MNNKRLNLILLGVFLAFPLLLFHVLRYFEGGVRLLQLADPQRVIWKIIFYVLSGLALVSPWLAKSGLLRLQFRATGQEPGSTLLILGYAFSAEPTLYGCVFFLMGAPRLEFVFFAVASMLGALAWGAYHLSATQ